MKKITLLKTLLMAVGLCMGGNAWAGVQNLYSQNFESFAADANFTSVSGYWQSSGANVQKILA